VVSSGAAYLPVVHSRLFSHELVDARAALGHASITSKCGPKMMIRAYVTKHEVVQSHEFCELSVTLVYLSCPTPQASRNGHRGEHAVVIKEQTFKCFLNEHQVNIGK
jgi:hypothetical protein